MSTVNFQNQSNIEQDYEISDGDKNLAFRALEQEYILESDDYQEKKDELKEGISVDIESLLENTKRSVSNYERAKNEALKEFLEGERESNYNLEGKELASYTDNTKMFARISKEKVEDTVNDVRSTSEDLNQDIKERRGMNDGGFSVMNSEEVLDSFNGLFGEGHSNARTIRKRYLSKAKRNLKKAKEFLR